MTERDAHSVGRTAPAGECDISVLLTPTGFVTPRQTTPKRQAVAPASGHYDDLHLTLESEETAAGLARRALATEFGKRIDAAVLADAQLVVSELVSNAVLHGVGDHVVLRATAADSTLSLSVTSRCRLRDLRREPAWKLPDPTQIGGRGFPIVSELSVSPPRVESSPDGAWYNQVTISAELTAG